MRSIAPAPAPRIAAAVVVATLGLSATAVGQPARPMPAPPVPPRAAPLSPAELAREGAAALEDGQLGKALALYERALGPTRADPRIWFDLCLVRYAAGDYGRAINACYRALPAHEGRVFTLLEQIAAAMRASGVRAVRLSVPEPDPRWYTPDEWLPESLASSEVPPERAGAVRAVEPPLPPAAGAAEALPANLLDRLRGRQPALPYRVPSSPDDYRVGLDLSARGGLLSYAPDTTPLVAGVRAEWRRRERGTSSHTYYFAEYLHATDKTGGIGAIGYGGRRGKWSNSIGLSVPWGRSEGRRDVLIPDHTISLNGEIRLGLFRDIKIDRAWAIMLEGSLVAGLNLGKAAIRLGDKISDACGSEETDCPETPDANPRWPLGHFMLELGVSFGYRGRHPRYDRAEVFAPMGGS